MIKRSGRVRSRRTCKAESRGHCHQIGERIGLHLSHHLTSVRLYRDLADVAQIETIETWKRNVKYEAARHKDSWATEEFLCRNASPAIGSTCHASRGDIALDLASQYRGAIPLVVSDIVLPEMDGPSAVSKLQKLHPEMQVLFVSGFAEVPVAQQLIAEGAPLLQKPVSRIDLMRKIDEMLHSRVSHC